LGIENGHTVMICPLGFSVEKFSEFHLLRQEQLSIAK
jgi:hypothetical protein